MKESCEMMTRRYTCITYGVLVKHTMASQVEACILEEDATSARYWARTVRKHQSVRQCYIRLP